MVETLVIGRATGEVSLPQGTVMEWLVVAAFLVFIGGIAVVTVGAVKHADKQSHD